MKKRMQNVYLFILPFLLTSIFTLNTLKSSALPVKHWDVPASALKEKKPVPANPSAAVAEGKKLYLTYCSACHGNSGKGDGMAAAALNPKPTNHSAAEVQNEPEASLYWKITTGRGAMVSYKQILSDNQGNKLSIKVCQIEYFCQIRNFIRLSHHG